MISVWTVLVAAWVILALVVVGLAVYRRLISWSECDVLHLRDGEAVIVPQQAKYARRLETIDRWGKRLTAVLIVSGAALFAVNLWEVWQQSLLPVR